MQQIAHQWIRSTVSSLDVSPTLAINERTNELISEGKHLYKLGLGQSPFPVPEHLVSALRTHAAEKDYLPVKGLPQLRKTICDYYWREEGLNFTPENILIGPGSKELLFLLQLCSRADLILPAPSWVSYAPQSNLSGNRVVWLDTRKEDDWRIDPDKLDAHCKTMGSNRKMMILNAPSNPVGNSYSVSRLQAIASVARKHGLLVLSDEIYGGLHHEGRHQSIARFYPEGTIIGNGISKWCGAGGWRLGAFAFPKPWSRLCDLMASVASESYTSVCAPIQYAAIGAFDGHPAMKQYLTHCRAILKGLGQMLATQLRDFGCHVPKPEGGFYLFPDFEPFHHHFRGRGIDTSEAFCRACLDQGQVAILPGSCFGRPEHEFTARVSYVNFDGSAALDAAMEGQSVDAAFLHRFCQPTLDAVNRICGWVESL